MAALNDVRTLFAGRSWWANGIFLFCLYMTVIYLPFDLFYKPVAEDQEVWFGLMFTGWSAKMGGVLHWLVYGFGAYGFLHHRTWLYPWAGLYVLQVALSMLLWAMFDERGSGLWQGTIAAAPFIGLALLLHLKPAAYTKH